MAKLTCDCGQEYEVRDDAPKWSACWIACPTCFLAADEGPEPYSLARDRGGPGA